jgi:DNA polymerase III subunit beta
MKKTIVKYEGQKNTIQGECKPKEAMEILGLNPKEWKVTGKEITDKALIYVIERARSLALVPVAPVADETAEPEEEKQDYAEPLIMTDALTGTALKEPSAPAPTIPTGTITVDREEFQAALQVVCDVTKKGGLMPVLGMVKIEATEEVLTISATDLEMSYIVTIPGPSSSATAFLVDADMLYKEVKALKAVEDVVISVNADSVQVNGRCVLNASVIDEFPMIETVEGTTATVKNLKHALMQALPAVSEDESRYILTGVCFDLKNGNLIGTDGFRLHRADVEKKDIARFVVPKRAAALLSKYDADTVTVSEKRLSSNLAGGTFTTRLIEGDFPDTSNIWPDVSVYSTVRFRAKEFLDLVAGILPIAEGGKINVTINGRIDIDARSTGGDTYNWHVAADSTHKDKGEPTIITINVRYLVDAIRAYAPSNEIDMAFPSGYGAIVVNEQALIMPIRV